MIFQIYFPPILEASGGEIFVSPPFWRGLGGKLKIASPPPMGGKKGPLHTRTQGIIDTFIRSTSIALTVGLVKAPNLNNEYVTDEVMTKE